MGSAAAEAEAERVVSAGRGLLVSHVAFRILGFRIPGYTFWGEGCTAQCEEPLWLNSLAECEDGSRGGGLPRG